MGDRFIPKPFTDHMFPIMVLNGQGGGRKIWKPFRPALRRLQKKCPWINVGLDALSDSCTIFFIQGIYLPSEARFTPSPMRTVRPDICLKGAYLETVFVHLVKISSHSQESAWKKCSMQLYKEGFRSRSLIIEVMPRESERTINPVMIAADHSNAAFLEKQGRKHNRISLINLSIWYFPSAGIYVIVRVR